MHVAWSSADYERDLLIKKLSNSDRKGVTITIAIHGIVSNPRMFRMPLPANNYYYPSASPTDVTTFLPTTHRNNNLLCCIISYIIKFGYFIMFF
jgi:hypothetical protein